METPAKHSHDAALKRLLEEGTRSYLEATTALVAYQQEVQKKCRGVVERSMAEYASALKVRLTSDELDNAAEPKISKWEDGWRTLGVKILRKDMPKLRWWVMECQLEYFRDDGGLACSVSEWFPTTKLAADIFNKFRRLNRNVVCDGKGVWLQTTVKVEEVSVFEESLDLLFQQWIELWKKVGGIKEAFKV